MAENSTFEEQWTLLRKETGMEDAPLRQKLEHFIFRQYGRVVLVHYVKALSALELSHHFYLRFRRRSRSRGGTYSLLDRPCGNNHQHDA